MTRNYFLITCLFCMSNLLLAQISNETLGTVSTEDSVDYTTGSSITTGSYNVMIGDGSGSSLTEGDSNTLLGTSSGAKLTTGDRNVLLGDLAGFNTDNDNDNIFIGFMAGYYNTRSDNVFIGKTAGFNNTDGDDNVFIGEHAGNRVTTGDDNTYIGDKAGASSSSNITRTSKNPTNDPATGSYNTAIGGESGFDLTTGYRNTFVGRRSGYDSTTGYKNTFVGDSTGVDSSVGRLNTFVGQAAGAATEHSDYNTFIGTLAGGNNNRTNNTNDSSRNTYLGVYAGFANWQGEDNVGIGAFADYLDFDSNSILNAQGFDTGTSRPGSTTTHRYRTTFVGGQSLAGANDVTLLGYDTQVNGEYGTAIGSRARVNNSHGVAIGYNVVVSQDNTMALGGDTTTNRLSVGIGTVAANKNASLDLADTDKGFLVNRVTTSQRNAMTTTPASGVALTTTDAGLMVYDTDENVFYFWNGTSWNELGKTTTGSGVGAVPELLNYQSLVRNASGDVLANQSVSFRLSVVDANTMSTTYSETHNITTTAQGLASLTIGNGTIVSGLFSDIDWSHSNSLQVELDVAGGSTYVVIGSTSFVSVPYALRAKYAENVTSSTNQKTGSPDSKNEEVEQLKQEVQELKAMVNKLLTVKE